jgi:hypothetical protein
MNQAVTFKSGGLHCDNPNCDWADENIAFEDYHKHVNASCTKCGENILTQADFESAQAVKDFADFMQNLAEGIGMSGSDNDTEAKVTFAFTGDGSGAVNINIEK